MTTKNKTTADRLKALRLEVNAAIAGAGTAREAADALTKRVRDGQAVSTDEWTTLPAAAAMADVKLDAIREAYEQERMHAEHEQVEAFVEGARGRLTGVPETDDRLAELAAHVKIELDRIIAEVDTYNDDFAEIHTKAREAGTESNSFYGSTTRSIVREYGMYADADSAGKLIRINGEEFRDLGTMGLIDDVAQHVKMLDAGEIPAQRFIPSDSGIYN